MEFASDWLHRTLGIGHWLWNINVIVALHYDTHLMYAK